ncbi:MAG: methyl-accepting chemotaxis protein [Succinivibrio sp.]
MKVVVQILLAFAVVLVIYAATNVISIYQSTNAKSSLTTLIGRSQDLNDVANSLKLGMQNYSNSVSVVLSSENEAGFMESSEKLSSVYEDLTKAFENACEKGVLEKEYSQALLGSVYEIVNKEQKAKLELLSLDNEILMNYQELGVSQISTDIVIKRVMSNIDDEFLTDSVDEYIEKRNAAILNTGKIVFTRSKETAEELKSKIESTYSEVVGDEEYLMQDIPALKSEKDFLANNETMKQLMLSDDSIPSKKVRYLNLEKDLSESRAEMSSKIAELDDQIAKVNSLASQTNDSVADGVNSILNMIIVVLLISMGMSLCVIFVVASILTRKISHPIRALMDQMNKLAKGDYTDSVTAKNWGFEFNVLAYKLNKVIEANSNLIGKIQDNNLDIKAQSVLNQVSMDKVADSSDEQSHTMHSILESLNTLGELNRNTSNAIDNTRVHTQSIQTAVADSLSAIDSNVAGNSQLNNIIEKASQTISKVMERTNDISQILEVIGDIANQTNLLALNAAIEAARAGEAGKGFAVVSDEVRELALKTARSTSKIKVLIDNLNEVSNDAVSCMKSCTSQMKENTANLEVTHRAISVVNDEITNLAAESDTVSSMVNEQNASFADISANVNSITCDLEENIKSIEQVRASSLHLEALSQEQQETLSEFKTSKTQ